MDNLTHSLVGALIGQSGLKRKTGLAMPALIVGANLPDIDAGCVVYGVESLAMRRGLTHGPIAWVILPLLLAAFLWWFDRWQARRGTRPESRLPVRFRWLFALSFTACLTHPALDWLNVYGIRLLEPFSSRWFYGDTLFIIDVWLWGAMGTGLALSLYLEKGGANWRRTAIVVLTACIAYIGANWLISRDFARLQSNDANVRVTIAAPVPFVFWQRDLIFVSRDGGHSILRDYAGPASSDGMRKERVGDGWLQSCRLGEIARSDPRVAAFLFWSRVPMVVRGDRGELTLNDARFFDGGARAPFSVSLPRDACTRFFER